MSPTLVEASKAVSCSAVSHLHASRPSSNNTDQCGQPSKSRASSQTVCRPPGLRPSLNPGLVLPSHRQQLSRQATIPVRKTTTAVQNGHDRQGRMRLDNLEEILKAGGDPLNPAWTPDQRLIAPKLGERGWGSRVRGGGVIVFDCGHTSPPTRPPTNVPPVTWYNPSTCPGWPWPQCHSCHDCDCNDRYHAQAFLLRAYGPPDRVAQLQFLHAEGIKAGQSQCDLDPIRDELCKLVQNRTMQTWQIWRGWEEKWGEKLFMNERGQVYGANPVVKGIGYVGPPSQEVRRVQAAEMELKEKPKRGWVT